jgi:MoxR-like ATPase
MNQKIEMLKNTVNKVIIGKDDTIIHTIISLLCGGHVLLEDVPGVGKTRLATALARSVNGKFNRIQLTPDVMPSDIVGFSMVNPATHDLEYREGVAMCNFLLADEINRASPKVQSALLEAMEEGQLTVDGVTHTLPNPFMVLATQNPVETSGTYRLPEAQTDRFFMRVKMGYPTREEEMKIFENNAKTNSQFEIFLDLNDIIELRKEIDNVKVSVQVKEYILDLTTRTRNDSDIILGVSPRGSIALYQAAKACAFIYERGFAIPEDVKKLAIPVLAHRLILSAKGKAKFISSENYISEMLKAVSVPI